MDNFFNSLGRQSLKPLGANNAVSSYDKKGIYGSVPKSPPGVRKLLFESRNKENDESMLCKDFTDRESTGKSPVVIPQRIKTGSNSDESEEKKAKPRRSMLGFRSKLNVQNYSKDDSTFTLAKPLHSSSPMNNDRYKTDEQRLQKATSTPVLSHPFDTDDADASSFFSKGLSDSTWSVFKCNKNSNKPQTYPDETPVGTLGLTMNQQPRFPYGAKKNTRNSANWKARQSVAHSMERKDRESGITSEQKMKLEWLALKYKNSVGPLGSTDQHADNTVETAMRKSYRASEKSSAKDSEHFSTLGARTRAQAKKEREKKKYEAISPVMSESEEMVIDNQDTTIISESNTTNDSSMDSYEHNEATIVGTCKKAIKTAEDDLGKLSISSKGEDSNDSEDHSEEYLSTHEDDPDPPNINSLLNLISSVKSEKEELDSKFAAYNQQKDRYDKKFNNLMTSLNLYMNDIKKNSKSKSKATKSQKVVSTKGKENHVSPTYFVKPRESTKNFSGLKANFNCLKTPNQTEKIKRAKKSVCYTPNSLSALVGDQVKDIFGDM